MLLSARGIGKHYGPVEVLRDVSLSVRAGEIRALCGENGAGKSTLVKIITGNQPADLGEIAIDGVVATIRSPADAQKLGIALVSQELSLAPNLSVLDNIWLGNETVPLWHRRRALAERARAALDEVGLEGVRLDRQVGTLGIGRQQLVEVARMLTRDARILILDEPTATLSDVEIAHVFEALRRLRARGHAIIYITHRLGEVFEVCDSVSVLRNGALVGDAATGAIDRAGLISAMLGRELGELYPPPRAAPVDGRPAISVRALAVPDMVHGIDFSARAGSLTCLAGQIGSGATEALRALCGLNEAATGEFTIGGRRVPLRSVGRARAAGVRFISENRAGEGIFLRLTIAENLLCGQLRRFSRGGLLRRRAMRTIAGELAAAVAVRPARLDVVAADLSGGNQQKLAFGRIIDGAMPGVLLMNEPTRGVDVGARAEIYRLVRRFCDEGWCVVMASSDLEEVMGLADEVITLYRGRVVRQVGRAAVTMHGLLADITQQQAA